MALTLGMAAESARNLCPELHQFPSRLESLFAKVREVSEKHADHRLSIVKADLLWDVSLASVFYHDTWMSRHLLPVLFFHLPLVSGN